MMSHDFVRCEAEERYGRPRVWRHAAVPDYVKCWITRQDDGRWMMHRRLTMPDAPDLSHYREWPPFDRAPEAIAAAEEWMQDYSERRQVNLDPRR